MERAATCERICKKRAFFHWRGDLSSSAFLINFSAPHSGPQMEWISSTLSENNYTFLVVACGMKSPCLWPLVALICPQNHTCRGLTRMFSLQKIASRSEDYSEFSSL